MRNRMIVLAGAFVLAASVLAGCSKTKPIVESPEVPSEVVSEVLSEAVSEIEVAETSEVLESEAVKLPELPIIGDDGNPYVAPELTADDIYAAIDNLAKYNLTDYERDRVIMTILYFNGGKLSDADFDIIRNDYLGNIGEATFAEQMNDFLRDFVSRENDIALSDLLVDKKEKEIADAIELYYNSDSFNDDDWKQFFVDYTNEVASIKEGSPLGVILDDIYNFYDVDFVCDIESFGGTFEMEEILLDFNRANSDRFNRQDYPEYRNESSYVSSHQE